MHIEIGSMVSSDVQVLIASAVTYFTYRFFSARVAHSLMLTIDELEDEEKSAGHMGMCEWETEYVRPRSFIIYVDTHRDIDEILTTIAHEMVHVRQFVSERLKHRFRPTRRVLWEGSEVDVDDTDYEDLPWEREAYALQEELAQDFVEHYIASHL